MFTKKSAVGAYFSSGRKQADEDDPYNFDVNVGTSDNPKGREKGPTPKPTPRPIVKSDVPNTSALDRANNLLRAYSSGDKASLASMRGGGGTRKYPQLEVKKFIEDDISLDEDESSDFGSGNLETPSTFKPNIKLKTTSDISSNEVTSKVIVQPKQEPRPSFIQQSSSSHYPLVRQMQTPRGQISNPYTSSPMDDSIGYDESINESLPQENSIAEGSSDDYNEDFDVVDDSIASHLEDVEIPISCANVSHTISGIDSAPYIDDNYDDDEDDDRYGVKDYLNDSRSSVDMYDDDNNDENDDSGSKSLKPKIVSFSELTSVTGWTEETESTKIEHSASFPVVVTTSDTLPLATQLFEVERERDMETLRPKESLKEPSGISLIQTPSRTFDTMKALSRELPQAPPEQPSHVSKLTEAPPVTSIPITLHALAPAPPSYTPIYPQGGYPPSLESIHPSYPPPYSTASNVQPHIQNPYLNQVPPSFMYQSFPISSAFAPMPIFRHSSYHIPQGPQSDVIELTRQLHLAQSEASLANKRLADLLLQLREKDLNGQQQLKKKVDDDMEYSFNFEEDKSNNSPVKISPPKSQNPVPITASYTLPSSLMPVLPQNVTNNLQGLDSLRQSLDSLKDVINLQTTSTENSEFKKIISNSQSLFQTQLKALRERLSYANASYLASMNSSVPIVQKAYGVRFDESSVITSQTAIKGSSGVSASLQRSDHYI